MAVDTDDTNVGGFVITDPRVVVMTEVEPEIVIAAVTVVTWAA